MDSFYVILTIVALLTFTLFGFREYLKGKLEMQKNQHEENDNQRNFDLEQTKLDIQRARVDIEIIKEKNKINESKKFKKSTR